VNFNALSSARLPFEKWQARRICALSNRADASKVFRAVREIPKPKTQNPNKLQTPSSNAGANPRVLEFETLVFVWDLDFGFSNLTRKTPRDLMRLPCAEQPSPLHLSGPSINQSPMHGLDDKA
jgi:hypothetical protein